MLLKYRRPIERGEVSLSTELAEAIHRIWIEMASTPALYTSNDCQLTDVTAYLMENIRRFGETDYIPSDQDVLHVRLPTTGVIETCFNFKTCKFRMFDVGGQRSERRKWIHVFDNVTTIIFTVAMSCYDQTLREDSSTNAMHESISLFSSICNHKYFKLTPTILFLNKKDIFQTKIKTVSLRICFPDYSGRDNYEDASEYLRQKMTRVNRQPKEIFAHFTIATDTNNINYVFDAAMTIILQENLKEAGMF